MDFKRLKKDMKQLWVATFHDREEYVDLVFDTYFRPEYCAWKYEGDRLVATLLGVPYKFDSLYGSLSGLYLCGLATDPDYRGHGVMSQLLEEINSTARQQGFDFTFLIPADEGLRRYYSDRNYSAAFRNVTLRYASGHSFYKEYVAWVNANDKLLKMERLRAFELLQAGRLAQPLNQKFDVVMPGEVLYAFRPCNIKNNGVDDYKDNQQINSSEFEFEKISNFDTYFLHKFGAKNDTDFEQRIKNTLSVILPESKMEILSGDNTSILTLDYSDIYTFIYGMECQGRNLELSHSALDFMRVLQENEMSGGSAFVASDSDGRVVGVAIVAAPEEGEVKVKRIFVKDEVARCRLLHQISLSFPDASISVSVYPDYNFRTGVSDIYYGAVMPGNGNVPEIGFAERVFSDVSAAQTYGMIRILSFSHFLEFLTISRSDSKYSIFVKDENSGEITFFSGSDGKFKEKSFSEISSSVTGLSAPDSVSLSSGDEKLDREVLTTTQLQALLMRKSDSEDAVYKAFGLPALQLNLSLLLD